MNHHSHLSSIERVRYPQPVSGRSDRPWSKGLAFAVGMFVGACLALGSAFAYAVLLGLKVSDL